MKDTFAGLNGIAVFCVGIVLLSVIALSVIWALNTVFVLNIPYALDTATAVLVLLSVIQTGATKK